MTKKIIIIGLCICCIGWIGLIFHLSTENGVQTAQTSRTMAEKISEIFYENATPAQVEQIHYMLRKSAHIILFLVLGLLVTVTGLYISYSSARAWVTAVAAVVILCLIVGTGWLDEWHKQFIDGRHYQISEAILNIISGLVGSGVVLFICSILKAKRKH